ncbi:Hypothetical_protein [Hexamita inflata]|uniref:Hypothetical_protein n=1 Tax=Hexamita inflata TaxID=28002 RepID=A0AA86R8N2_9EUKA|nr:Hypothetical protein HINF_LOCUS57041 [Hexamita inflata]
MWLGQIGCGRQNPPIQSAELASSRIGMAKGMPSTNLQDWQKAVTAPLLPQKRRWYDAGGFPYRSACTKQPCYAPWMLVPESLVALVAEVRLTYIGVSNLMIIRVILQFLYRRPNQYKRKLSEWNIFLGYFSPLLYYDRQLHNYRSIFIVINYRQSSLCLMLNLKRNAEISALFIGV